MVTAHAAGLMLLPFMLGPSAALASAQDAGAPPWSEPGHAAVMDTLARSNLATALAVASGHTLAMLTAVGLMAWLVYR